MIEALETILERFAGVRILCVGDIMLDRFIRGTVERISPEAPVPLLKYSSDSDMLGGAGNVLANLAAISVATRFVGRCGADPEGERLIQLLEAMRCDHELIRSATVPTATKTRFVAENNHILRFDRETVHPLSDAEADTLIASIEASLFEYDLVLVSDYAKGLLTEAFTKRLILACAQQGKRVLVDPKGRNYEKYRGAFLIKPNRKELELVCDVKLPTNSPTFIDDVAACARTLGQAIAVEHVIVTLGSKGMLHVPINGTAAPVHLPTRAKEVFDVSGAGDTSFAVLGASIAACASLTDAMHLANLASGIVVGKLGTATVSTTELCAALQEEAHTGAASYLRKILSREEALRYIQAIRSPTKKIGFTNGCFDLLHLGHLDSLWQAKLHCDFLVVGLNSDASVQRLKGPARPVQSEATRAALLASLECVDLVVIFDDDTALPLIEQLRPDVIAKEGYPIEKWPEAQCVIAYGGTAITLKRKEGFSTTELVERMKQ